MDGKEVADQHSKWFMSMVDHLMDTMIACRWFSKDEVVTIMEKVYHDSMVHGYKHGYDDGKKVI